MIRSTWMIRDRRCFRRLSDDPQVLVHVTYGFPPRKVGDYSVTDKQRLSERYWGVVMLRKKMRWEKSSLSYDLNFFTRRMA